MTKDHKHRVIIEMVHGNLVTSIHPRCEHNTYMICDAKIFHDSTGNVPHGQLLKQHS